MGRKYYEKLNRRTHPVEIDGSRKIVENSSRRMAEDNDIADKETKILAMMIIFSEVF